MSSVNLTPLRFYSSSLLFVYEGLLCIPIIYKLGNPNVPFKSTVKMIDFAHVFPITDGGTDEGYYKGSVAAFEN